MKAWRGKLEAHAATWSSRIPSMWLARFVYRFDDVTSAAEILNRGVVYSRKRAEKLGCIVHDQASPQVIEGTPEHHREFVRLYFRPKTPTQWHAEGIRPRPSITPMGAHCPVPVFLCFDFVETLAMDGTLFSDGNMASPSVTFGDTEVLFDSLPFDLIYHRGWFAPENKASIIYHRCAEVLVPDELPLNHKLRLVACRSIGEQRTLLHLLDPKIRKYWAERIRVGPPALFQRDWWFVENVEASGNVVTVSLHSCTAPIDLSYERRAARGKPFTASKRLVSSDARWAITARGPIDGVVTIRLDGHLAFKDRVVGTDMPF